MEPMKYKGPAVPGFDGMKTKFQISHKTLQNAKQHHMLKQESMQRLPQVKF